MSTPQVLMVKVHHTCEDWWYKQRFLFNLNPPPRTAMITGTFLMSDGTVKELRELEIKQVIQGLIIASHVATDYRNKGYEVTA